MGNEYCIELFCTWCGWTGETEEEHDENNDNPECIGGEYITDLPPVHY